MRLWMIFLMSQLSFLLYSQDISENRSIVSWQADYDKALQKAKRVQKPLMIFLIHLEEPDLTQSRKILKTYFMNRSYIFAINHKVVPVLITYGQKNSYPVELYYTTHFPVLFLVDSQKELFLQPPLYDDEITPENITKLLSTL